jgi:lipopolysaccharide transport system ATP-binding protein
MGTVIKIEDLWKQYRLGVIGYGTLRADLQSWWARKRGKEDPNEQVLIGALPQTEEVGQDRFWALQGVDLEVEQAEVLGIIGPNGAGKSTLLKILSQITRPTRGQVKIKGRVASLLEVGTGFHPELTGRENIFLNGTILGMTTKEITRKFDEIVDFSGVEKFLATPVKRYSSGMYVRLAFAVAAHLESEILIVDEVLAVGDAEFQKKCLGKMSEVCESGRTILFVSHNMVAIRELCHRTILLESGRVIDDGESNSIISKYINRNIQYEAILTQEMIEKVKINYGGIAQKMLKIREIRISDEDGIPRSQYCSDEKIEVVVEYECLTQLHDLAIIIMLFDEYRQPVLSNSNKDYNNAAYAHEAGIYQASCIFPANLFGGKRFYVAVKLLLPGDGKITSPPILSFEVDFTGKYGKNYCFSPRLPVTMHLIDGETKVHHRPAI